jgi:hypothetical protein
LGAPLADSAGNDTHCIYYILYKAIPNHVKSLCSRETMGVAKLRPEQVLWVRATTVQTIKAKFLVLILQQKRTKCLKEYIKIMPLVALFPAHVDLLMLKPLIFCVHILNKL